MKPQCLRCGDCCKAETLLISSPLWVKIIARIIYFLKGKNIKTAKCKHLTFQNGIAVCKIYSRKPQFCKDYYCDKCYIGEDKKNKLI